MGNINKKPLVGFGVVGTKTLIKFLPVFCAISPLFSFVAKPTAQTPFLGYSIKTTLFFPSSFFEKFLSFEQLQNKLFLKMEFF